MSHKNKKQSEQQNETAVSQMMEETETSEEVTETKIEEWETDMPEAPEPEEPKKNFFSKITGFLKDKLFEEEEEEDEEEEEETAPEEPEEEIIEETESAEEIIQEESPAPAKKGFFAALKDKLFEDVEEDEEEEEDEEIQETEEPQAEEDEAEPLPEEIPETSPPELSENISETPEISQNVGDSEVAEAPELMPEPEPEFSGLEMYGTIRLSDNIDNAEVPDEPADTFAEINDEPEDTLPDLDYLDDSLGMEETDLPDLEYLEEEIPEVPEELEKTKPEEPSAPDDSDNELPSASSEPLEEEGVIERPPVLRILIVTACIALFIFLIVLGFKNGMFSEKEIYYMPDLTGRNYYDLQSEDLNLDIVIGESDFSGYEKDFIYAQDIPAGTEIKLGQTVHVNLSLGLAMTTVPDIRNYPYEYAQKTLEQQGFQTEILYESSLDGTEENNVIRTEPAKDEEVPVGSKITIYVSQGLGANVAQVQNVVGRTLSEATAICEKYGLDVEPVGVPSLEAEGTVLSQSLTPNTTVDFHTVITLTYSNGEEPEGVVNFQLNLPAYTNGRFILDFIDKDGNVIASSNMIVAGFSAGSLIPVNGYGSQQITVILNNYSTNQQAELGTYSFDFTTGAYTVLTEDTESAFRAVGGIE